MAEATRQHTKKTLSDEDKQFLRDLPLTASVERDRQRFFLCHAPPSDPLFAYCPPESPDWSREAEAIDADLILVGHTHLPFVKHIGHRMIVNPGSLGQPKHGGPQGSYAVWQDGNVTLHTVPYPVERTIEKLHSCRWRLTWCTTWCIFYVPEIHQLSRVVHLRAFDGQRRCPA